jgi:NAD(P)-dependent dehydrogenase (short-subunit alcohol dehydrogenase family)
MPTVLITGANRGIGLEFARQYAAEGWRVLATVRDPAAAEELRAVEGEVDVRRLDLEEDLFSIDWDAVAGDESLDLFIANAGTWGPERIEGPDHAAGWINTFVINTVAPVLLADHLIANLAPRQGKMVAITSKMGSIEDNKSGGYIAYRSTKAALNAAWRSLSVDVARHGITAAVLHPGWVQTRMGGASAPLTPEQSVSGMRQVIAGLSREQSGGFFNYDGSPIPW